MRITRLPKLQSSELIKRFVPRIMFRKKDIGGGAFRNSLEALGRRAHVFIPSSSVA